MLKKEKKSFARSKKFDEIKMDVKSKQVERSIQKKTGYERDIRTMTKRVLADVQAAVEGEGEITVEELRQARHKLDKLITKTRVLANNKKVNLDTARGKLEHEKQMIMDYIQGKRECPGLVNTKGQGKKSTPQPSHNENQENVQVKVTESDNSQPDTGTSFYANLGFTDDEEEGETQEEYFRNLGFEDREEEVIANPVPRRRPVAAIRSEPSTQNVQARIASFRRMATVFIDERLSNVINEGIEHLMHYRRRRKSEDLSFRDETVRFIEQEISYTKSKSLVDLKNRGYGSTDLDEFSRMFDYEYETNKNWMIRKCLHMSRVLEYRKGSTASG